MRADRRPTLIALLPALVMLAALAAPGRAHAAASPGWTIASLAEPTNFSSADSASTPGHPGCIEEGASEPPEHEGVCDRYLLTVRNAGSAASTGTVTISDLLPPQLALANVEATDLSSEASLECTTTPLRCSSEEPLPPGGVLQMTVRVTVAEGTSPPTVLNQASVEGAGAPTVSTSAPSTTANAIDGPPPAFGIQDFSLQTLAPDGTPDLAAGDHPYALTAQLDLNSRFTAERQAGIPFASVQDPRDLVIDLPLGLAADALAATRCPQADIAYGHGKLRCPASSRVGDVLVNLDGSVRSSLAPEPEVSPLYDIQPEPGYPAEFATDLFGQLPVILYARVVPTPAGYRLRIIAPGLLRSSGLSLDGFALAFYGDPAEHDQEGPPQAAMFANPTSCSAEPLTATAYVDSWSTPGEWSEHGDVTGGPNGPASEPLLSSPGWVGGETTVYPQLTGCDALQFNPLVSLTPTTTQADHPSGYAIDVQVPQAPNVWPDRATPDIRDLTVTFPSGTSIDPAAADGLTGCSEAQFAPSSSEKAACPSSSVIGTATITTPLLESPLTGQVFLRASECEGAACEAGAERGRLLGLFIQAQGSGVNIKLEGNVELGTGSPKSLASGLQPGQLRAVFNDNPQLPVGDLQIQLAEGPQAPLANPATCGTATTAFQITPWSSEVPEERRSSFAVDENGEGVACPPTQPFAPSFSSGLSFTNAAGFSPFTLTFSRQDGEQDLSSISLHTPDGVGAILAGVPECPEPQAAAGACPSSSEIGSSNVAIGAGSAPYWLPQPGQPQNPVFLTGPYAGAPFGLAIVVHADAGPFHLGDVVVRAGISVDPITSALTIATGPLPQIIDGIPLRMRSVNVDIDRPGFMFAPTDCTKSTVTAMIASAQGAQAPVSSPFDVGGCQTLPFHPKLTATTAGSGSFAGHGASLAVKIAPPAEGPGSDSPEANLKTVHVQLPRSLPTRLSTLQGACVASLFASNPSACPPSSIVGSATIDARTLPDPLRGPAYLVSHGGAAFPDLVLVLKGDGVTIQLTGKTEIKHGVTYTHFDDLPDSPISAFELNLPEGPQSVLAATRNLCTPTTTTVTRHLTVRSHGHTKRITRKLKEKIIAPLLLPTRLEAQNGAVVSQTTKVGITGCPKPKAKKTRAAKR